MPLKSSPISVRSLNPPFSGHVSTLHCSTAYRLPGQPDLAEAPCFLQYRNLILAPPPHVALQSSHGPHSDQAATILSQGSTLHFLTSASFPQNDAIEGYRARTLIPPPQEAEQAVQLPQPICNGELLLWRAASASGASKMCLREDNIWKQNVRALTRSGIIKGGEFPHREQEV